MCSLIVIQLKWKKISDSFATVDEGAKERRRETERYVEHEVNAPRV